MRGDQDSTMAQHNKKMEEKSESSDRHANMSNSDKSNEIVGSEDTSSMSEHQKRLLSIRMRMNAGRKANKEAAEEEFKRGKDPTYESKKTIAEKKSSAPAVTEKEDSMMHVTAEESQRWQEKRAEKEKSAASLGWQAFTSDATVRSYEKSLKKLPVNTGEKEHSEDVEIDDINYGGAAKVDRAGANRLAKDIEEREAERAKFSRRRQHLESADVDYINDANAAFNKRIKRAFDKYTVEIRQNLERGTAI